MIKVAVLDDYQNIFREFVNIEDYKGKFDFKIFTKPFPNEDVALLELESFDAILVMRERTKIYNDKRHEKQSYRFGGS